MKKFLSSVAGKRVMIGLGMLALAIAAGVTLSGPLLVSGVPWKRALFFLLVLGTGVSGVLLMLFGRKGLLFGYGGFLGIALFLILPDDWKRYFLFTGLLCAVIVPIAVKYMKMHKAVSQRAVPARKAKTIQKQHEENQAWLMLPMENKPLLVAKKATGIIYQVFFQEDSFLLYKVGSFFHDLTEENLLKQDALPELSKNDIKILVKDVTMLRFYEVYSDNDPFDTQISIYTRQKRYFLSAIEMAGGKQLEQLLREKISPNVQMEKRSKPHFIPSLNRERRKLMKKVYYGICAFAAIVELAWLFLDVPYGLFAWLSLLPTPMLLMLHYLFPNEVTLAEEKKFAHGRTMIIFPTMLTVLPLIFRMNIDYSFLSQGKLFLITCIFTLMLIVQAFFTSKECRMRKIQLVGLAFMLFVYSFSAIGLSNALLDRTPPVEKNAIVQKLHVTSTRSSISYYFDVETEDKQDYTLEVGYGIYDQTETGDIVLVYFYQGAFDIAYTQVEPAA